MTKGEFLNRVRSLFNIDGHLLPELTRFQQESFIRDPVKYFIGTDKAQSDAIWREVEKRQPLTDDGPDKPVIDPRVIYVQFADSIMGEQQHIRKWSHRPFEGGVRFFNVTDQDLKSLDRITDLTDKLAEFGMEAIYDDAWNLRNRIEPFPPGHRHYDPECDGGDLG